MLETLVSLPFSFWVVLCLLVGGGVWASGKIRSGIGLPMLAVVGTVSAWYVADLFYNDYQFFVQTFAVETLKDAWWEVALFLIGFFILTPTIHHMFNTAYLRHTSSVHRLWRTGVSDPILQRQLNLMVGGCVVIWGVLALIATIRLGSEAPHYFLPFWDHKAEPWGRGRLGTGFDSLLALAGYVQLFVSSAFGIGAALVQNPRGRRIAMLGCALTWPYYIFDRTRNVMLSAMLPGILTWTVLRLRGGWAKKGIVLFGFFLLISAWFGFVLANRASMTITEALGQKEFNFKSSSRVHHDGLNMYEELCWINTLMTNSTYQPNWGERYFAEVVNFIPRALWPGKPLVGLDYAAARGQTDDQGDGGVGASISTGMIGQGVVNFGRLAGPPFAALLMSIWATVLARLDLRGRNTILYTLGLTLTFNTGRDITLLTLYTFVFGAVVVWVLNRYNRGVVREVDKPVPASLGFGRPGGRQYPMAGAGIGYRP